MLTEFDFSLFFVCLLIEREHIDEGGPVLAVPRAGRTGLGLALPRLQAVRRVLPVDARGDGEEGGDPHTVGIGHRRLRRPERRARQHTRRVQSEFPARPSVATLCLTMSFRNAPFANFPTKREFTSYSTRLATLARFNEHFILYRSR